MVQIRAPRLIFVFSVTLGVTRKYSNFSKCKKRLIFLATPAGFEPATPSLEGWCSIRLSYGVLTASHLRASRML